MTDPSTKQRPLAPDGYQYGVRFHDGSVRHCWSGATQRQRALEERDELRTQYPRDHFALVRRSATGDWVSV